MSTIIEVHNLTKKYNGNTAVEDLSFDINKGEVFGLLGPNGAGKTTTIRMLCCLISPSSGTARVGDYDVADINGSMKIRKMIGLVPDNVGLYESLSVVKNLEFFGRMYEAPMQVIKENIEKYLKMLDLWNNRDQAVGTFSKGMKQKVAVVRALVHDPDLLIMDEPTANLDPEAAKTIREVILDLKKDNRTIMLNTHNLDEAQRICDRIGILKTKLLAIDTPASLERTMYGRKTEIIVENINESIVNAVKLEHPLNIEINGDKMMIEMKDPDRDTPSIVSSITAAGGRIKSVSETRASLEDVYLKLVKE